MNKESYSFVFFACCMTFLCSIAFSAYFRKIEIKKFEQKIEHRLKDKVVEVRKG